MAGLDPAGAMDLCLGHQNAQPISAGGRRGDERRTDEMRRSLRLGEAIFYAKRRLNGAADAGRRHATVDSTGPEEKIAALA